MPSISKSIIFASDTIFLALSTHILLYKANSINQTIEKTVADEYDGCIQKSRAHLGGRNMECISIVDVLTFSTRFCAVRYSNSLIHLFLFGFSIVNFHYEFGNIFHYLHHRQRLLFVLSRELLWNDGIVFSMIIFRDFEWCITCGKLNVEDLHHTHLWNGHSMKYFFFLVIYEILNNNQYASILILCLVFVLCLLHF